MIPLFDLHCDTLLNLYHNKYSIKASPLHISLDKTKIFSPYNQVLAIWSDCRLSPKEAYNQYRNVIDYAKNQEIYFAKSFNELLTKRFILAIEGGKIAEGDLNRLNEFKNDGVKIITLCWSDTNDICGAWNTSLPLTEFGRSFVRRCFDLSIIPDVSHASVETMKEVINLAKKNNKTIIASHSNSYTICNHNRNLRDDDFVSIKYLDGLVGISMAPQHLSIDTTVTIDHIIKHINHYLSLGGENTVCLGCDFDGVSSLPEGINDISDLERLYIKMQKEFGEEITNKIFYYNAENFFKKNF